MYNISHLIHLDTIFSVLSVFRTSKLQKQYILDELGISKTGNPHMSQYHSNWQQRIIPKHKAKMVVLRHKTGFKNIFLSLIDELYVMEQSFLLLTRCHNFFMEHKE